MGSVVQIVAPSHEPITLAEARAWLRVVGTNEDALIQGLIQSARGYVETFTRRALINRQLELSGNEWPYCSREIVLPQPPLVSVESIKYYDTAGDLQTLSPSYYHVDTRAQPGRVVLKAGYSWPAVECRPNAVIVAYTAGYGTSSKVPAGIRTAMRYMVSHWFENRTHVNIGNIVNEIPETVDALLWMHRMPEAA